MEYLQKWLVGEQFHVRTKESDEYVKTIEVSVC